MEERKKSGVSSGDNHCEQRLSKKSKWKVSGVTAGVGGGGETGKMTQ